MGTTKIPMRGIAKLLTNLDPAVRARLESAFVEAENVSTFHNNATINDQKKRILSSLVDAPVLSVDTNTLGYDVHWPKLKDRLISFYELQVSLSSNFAVVQTYKTVDAFFSAEGVTSDTFIRVRAVRWDGQCGNWSDSVHVAASSISSPVVISRSSSEIPSFYREFPALLAPDPVQHLTIVPQRANGGIMVFGSFGLEFYVDATGQRGAYANTDPDAPLNDMLSVTINGAHVNTTKEIPVNDPGDHGTPTHRGVIGYSVGFGPAFLPHSGFYFSNYENWPSGASQGTTHGVNGTHDGWHNLKGLTGIIENVITNVSVDGSYYEIDTLASGDSTTTKTLSSKQHYFHLPAGRTVNGIEVILYGETQVLAGIPTVTVDRISLVDAGTVRPTDRSGGEPLPGTTFGAVPIALTYGSPTDLWGEAPGFWTAGKINNKNFGALLRLAMSSAGGSPSSAFMAIYGLEIKVFTNNSTETAEVDVIYIPSTQDLTTYPDRRGVVTNATLNVIEFGDELT